MGQNNRGLADPGLESQNHRGLTDPGLACQNIDGLEDHQGLEDPGLVSQNKKGLEDPGLESQNPGLACQNNSRDCKLGKEPQYHRNAALCGRKGTRISQRYIPCCYLTNLTLHTFETPFS